MFVFQLYYIERIYRARSESVYMSTPPPLVDKRKLFLALKDLDLDLEETYIDYLAIQLFSLSLVDTLITICPWTKEKATAAAAFLIARQFHEDVSPPAQLGSVESNGVDNNVDNDVNILAAGLSIDSLSAALSTTATALSTTATALSTTATALSNDSFTYRSQYNENLKPLPPVCRHYMQGDCRRKDCAFSHDLKRIPCKFHSSTGDSKKVCSVGNDCPFLHETRPGSGVDIRSIDNDTSKSFEIASAMTEEEIEFLFSGERFDEIGPLDLDDEESFPSLSGPCYAYIRKQSLKKTNTVSSISIASKLALQVLSDAFPTAPSEFLKRCFEDGKGGVIAAARLVVEQSGLEPVKSALTGRNLLIQPTYTASQIGGGNRLSGGRDESTARLIASSLFHATTGDDMSALYTMHRREAEAMARERNALFDKAARAFLSGNGASAAALSKEGRKLDDKMKAAHSQAASAIFSSRNSSKAGGGVFTVNATHGPVTVSGVDLHGLHSIEAIRASEEAVYISSSGVQWIALLAGARSHSNSLGGAGPIYDSVLEHFSSGRCANVMEAYGINGSVIVLRLSKS